MAGGRPSKYDPKYCNEVIDHMKQGYSLESFGGRIGVCKATIYEWRDAHQEFSDAIKEAQTACQYFWEHNLVQTIHSPKEMNATTVYFALKCRFGYKETQAVEHSGPDGKPIETKAFGSDDEVNAKIKAILEKSPDLVALVEKKPEGGNEV